IARYGRFINLASYYLVLEEVTMEEQEDSQPSTRLSCSGHKATFHMHCKRRDIMSHLGGTWDNLPVFGSERRSTIRKILGAIGNTADKAESRLLLTSQRSESPPPRACKPPHAVEA